VPDAGVLRHRVHGAERQVMRTRRVVSSAVAVMVLFAGIAVAAGPADAAIALTVTPDTGLAGGQAVAVAGSGLTPGGTAGWCQGVPLPEGVTPIYDEWCAVGVNGSGPVGADGSFGAPLRLHRFVYVPGLAEWVDCTATVQQCSVGAADVADVAGTGTEALVEFAAPPAPPATRGTISLSVATDLHHDEVITVTGSAFRAGQQVDLFQCFPGAGAPADPSSCGLLRTSVGTDTDGAFSVGLSIQRTVVDAPALVGQGGTTYDCLAAPSGPCRIVAAEAADFPATAVASPVTMEATPVVTAGAVTLAEGDSGTTTMQVPVTLSVPSSRTVTASWTTLFVPGAPAGQADPATDYAPVSGTVVFLPGETSKTVPVTMNGDTTAEPDEYVVVSFHDPTNAVMGGYWGLGFAVVADDDTPPTYVFSDAHVTEGASGTEELQVSVVLSSPWHEPLTLEWETSSPGFAGVDWADPGTDYAAASGTITFAPGETTKTVSVVVNGDTVTEPDEVFLIGFCDDELCPSPEHPQRVVTATISNDDPRPTVLPGVGSIIEGGTGTTELQVPVTLSNPSSSTVTVSWTTLFVPGAPAGQAEPVSDYTPTSGTVTFAPGETTRTVTVLISGDALDEADEYIVVSFHDPTNAIMGGFWGLGFGVITDDDVI
jgi:hypothetical protein